VAERQREPGNGVRDDDRHGEHYLRRRDVSRQPPLRFAGLTLQGLSIAELAALLRSGGASPVDLVRESLARIEADRELNAYATVLAERALAAAALAERELREGRDRGPLHGLPVALKDNFDTASIRTTGGSAAYADRVPARDAESWRLLREAGAVLVAKTNLHELGYRVPHPDFGGVRNPHDRRRTAGGSSSGSGAAVAAGHVVAALGTDTGGSVRQPAAYCGLVGVKPGRARISRHGVIPLSRSLDAVGVLARDVDDAETVLEAFIPPGPPQRFRARVGVTPASDDRDVSTAVSDAIALSARRLAEHGHDVVEHRLQELVSPRRLHRAILLGEAYAEHRAVLDHTGPLFRAAVSAGARVTRAELAAALSARERHTDAFFGGYDALLLPTTPGVAPLLDPESGRAAGDADLTRWTFIANLLDVPAASIPVATSEGLPIGVQLVARRGGEALLLALARAVFTRVTPPAVVA
jgi:aspartyl-tRNA(Asn)/glutamyl-tRNA(Gln) amidotransferase subunit A